MTGRTTTLAQSPPRSYRIAETIAVMELRTVKPVTAKIAQRSDEMDMVAKGNEFDEA